MSLPIAVPNREHYPDWIPIAWRDDGSPREWRCSVCDWTTTQLHGPGA
jgi:hypothetical protein